MLSHSRVAPLTLGSKTFKSNIFYAPLAGCSDYPFRSISTSYQPGLVFCEMVKMEPLLRCDEGTFRLLDYDASMHPIGAQLCGSKVGLAKKAAKIIEDLGFDVLDYNCGCPVDKVTKDGSGSGMLKYPELIGDILCEMVHQVKIPVTVKIRAGWDDESIVAPQITEIAEKAGAKAITIHGRTREQAYKGKANWEYIKEAKKVAKEIKVIGNGDLFEPPSVFEMFEATGCDGVLISRGTLGQPWFCQDVYALSRGETSSCRTLEEIRQALLEHFHALVSYYDEPKVLIEMRKVGCWYFKKNYQTKEFRWLISHATSFQEVKRLILEYPFVEETQSEDLILI